MKAQEIASPPDTRWHLDELFISINCKNMYLWRAVKKASPEG